MTDTECDGENCPRVETIPELGLQIEKIEESYLVPIKTDVSDMKKSMSIIKISASILGASLVSITLGYWLTLLGILPL